VRVRRRRGRAQLQLEPGEDVVLLALFDDLERVIMGRGEAKDDVTRRLFPSAYPDDPRAQAEYVELTADGLAGDRLERIRACRAEVAAANDIELDEPDAGRRWIQVLNDLRLTIGTRLGITEDDDHQIDPDEPAYRERLVYYVLTGVQDAMVRTLMG
jgi:hypothetical protein